MDIPYDRFGVSSILFRELTLEQALENINNTNFRIVDIGLIPPDFCPHYRPLRTTKVDDARLKELVEKYQLTVSSLNAVPGYFNMKGSSSEEISRFIRRSIEIAQCLGVGCVTIPPGIKANSDVWLENAKLAKKYLLKESAFAVDNGISLSLETPHKGMLAENVQEAVDFHDLLDSSNIKCTLDTSHVISSGSDLSEALDAIGIDRIDHVHLRDAVSKDIGITPGKGEGNFPKFFAKLRDSSYCGEYVFELEYDRMSVSQRLKELNFAKRYCTYAYEGCSIPPTMQLQRSRYFQVVERFVKSPVKEIKKHQKIYDTVRSLVPGDVYEGRWKKRYQLGKFRVHVDPPQSVPIQGGGNKGYRIGVVGTGWAGTEMHGPGFERLVNVKLIGGFDVSAENASKFAKRFDCPSYESIDELVEKGMPDIVAVCSSEPAHYQAVKLLLSRGVDVFCEKLMTTRVSEARELVDSARKNDRVLGVNYNYRFMPGIQKLKEIIEGKALGDLALLNITAHGRTYAHALDLLSYLGGPIRTVSGTFRNDNALRNSDGTDWSVYDDDILYVPTSSASVTVEFKNDILGSVNSSIFYRINAFTLAVEAIFERGVITLNGINLFNSVGDMSYCLRQRGITVNVDHKKGVYTKGFEYSFYESVKDFMEAIVQRRSPETAGEQGLFNITLEKAITKSHVEKRKVEIAEFG